MEIERDSERGGCPPMLRRRRRTDSGFGFCLWDGKVPVELCLETIAVVQETQYIAIANSVLFFVCLNIDLLFREMIVDK
jgi:hypothetical protein